MFRTLVGSVVVFLGPLTGAAQSPAPTHRIDAVDHQAVVATITYEVRAGDFTVTRWTAFLPEPPELPSQTGLKVRTEPVGKVVLDRSPLARPVRLIDQPVRDPKSGAKLALKLEVEATLRSRKLVPLKPGEKAPAVPALSAAEQKAYLATDGRADHESKAFRDWLDAKRLRLVKRETPIELAARILDVIRTDYQYAYEPAADRRASVVCGRKASDCGGMSLLFVAAMRANGVPARLLVGRTALPPKPGSTPGTLDYDRPHARAEFHVPGVGWVPVDPAYANLDTARPVADFVGHDPGDLLVLHLESDLKLPFPDQTRSADLLQLAPAVWVHGKGKTELTFAPAGWDLKATPARGTPGERGPGAPRP
jgi:transglutaminase-like putative cysteine protease